MHFELKERERKRSCNFSSTCLITELFFLLIEHLKELALQGTNFESPGTGSSEVVGPGLVSWLWLGQIKLGYRVI